MAGNIDEENDFDKGTITLKVSEVLGEAGEELRTIWNYFNERRGLPIGSGHVEAANKTHVGDALEHGRWPGHTGHAFVGQVGPF